MPARLSRSSVSTEEPHSKRKRVQKRALNALSIAEEEEPDRPRVRQHRLGESEGGESRWKRRRLEHDEEEDEEEDGDSASRRRQKHDSRRERGDELDVSEGSDSEGNTWQMGHVDEDDDSDIDSDDAFGDSDEERFEGFTFRGSSTNKPKPKRDRASDGDDEDLLDEDGKGDADNDDDDESLGEEAVDLATMLDNYEEEEEEEQGGRRSGAQQKGSQDDKEDIWSPSEDEAEPDESAGLAKMSAIVSALPVEDDDDTTQRKSFTSQGLQPGKTATKQKVTFDDLLGKSTGTDIAVSKRARKLATMNDRPSKNSGASGRLDVAPAKRVKDQNERKAADKKARETLDRWVDTVKHNRRAEHVSFPLADPTMSTPAGAKRLLPTSASLPATDLESAISNILQESGLGGPGKKDEEEEIQEFEELQMRKMPIEEVEARRAQLRMARDLMFREEIRAKRIKKIKSKAYRRVHRKEKERAALRDADIFGEGEMSDDERERLDRRRAEERMGAKHRDSKWAKSMKQAGRAAWDEDARAGIVDMARRNEELRRRIEGKEMREESDEISESSDNEEGDDDEGATRKMQQKLNNLQRTDDSKLSGIAGMKFMQVAEAARKAQNDEDIDRLRRELAGEDSFEDKSNDEETNVQGRRKYGPKERQASKSAITAAPQNRSEFEERNESDGDDQGENDEVGIAMERNDQATQSNKFKQKFRLPNKLSNNVDQQVIEHDEETENPFLNPKKRNRKKKAETQASVDVSKKGASPDAATDTDGWITVSHKQNGAETGVSDNEEEPPTLSRNELLVQQAFAGDYTAEDFEKQKNAVIEEEDEKVIDNALPGWGSWAGAGVSRREQNRNKGRFLTKQDGVKLQDRKDVKLKNVIINEKRVKKNGAYLASQLPFPYGTREEYERSMRMPVGGEWNTKVTLQENVKPRVLVKQGMVIKPIEKPLV
ncbi:Utp14-domain-containing protein [Rhizodiscina lignyota]|uniref:Utp14-domain-containing protein n=1 Tax=Rhizodiscina lignyota TaxID=1504668 RepID=A0A9P4LZC1_9PEZI|nr:Utp14-domain-containing protein [Rhizodiscina lignyota]